MLHRQIMQRYGISQRTCGIYGNYTEGDSTYRGLLETSQQMVMLQLEYVLRSIVDVLARFLRG